MAENKKRAPRNRTITLTGDDSEVFKQRLNRLNGQAAIDDIIDTTICQDTLEAVSLLPTGFVDLLIIDPPYNLNKVFGTKRFRQASDKAYMEWVSSWLTQIIRLLKPTASIYVCGDWRSSPALYFVLKEHFIIRNRITWEREKGRGANTNWKNSSEDIWFCTMGNDYCFNVDDVKLRRKVIAPYRHSNGAPKDWQEFEDGNFRLTYPSNLWTDITVPFWSMPENTDHPTQKPEKLIAKLILASSNEGDVVFDPFLGSGTTSVVAKKLGRRYVGVEIDETYCCLAEKRLMLADQNISIQGYQDGVFWERNTLNEQVSRSKKLKQPQSHNLRLFDEGN